MAPASAPERRSSRNCGAQPLRALAQPVSISADRNSWRTKGWLPASAFHSSRSTSASESTTRTLSKALRYNDPDFWPTRADPIRPNFLRRNLDEEDRSDREAVQAGRGARGPVG